MMYLKQSTAVTIAFGPFLDDTDGKTAETGLTIAQADIRLSKNGGAFAQSNNAAGATHMEAGFYSVPLNTTDTDTIGRLKLAASKAGALPVWMEFHVLAANVFDSLMGAATDKLEVDARELGGAVQSATDLKDFADTGYDPVAHKVAGVVLADTLTTYTGDTPQTGDSFARIGVNGAGLTAAGLDQAGVRGAVGLASANLDTQLAALAAYIDTEVAAILAAANAIQAKTDLISGAPSTHSAADVWAAATRRLSDGTNIVLAKGTGLTGLNDLSAAQVNAEVLDVLTVDTFAELSAVPAATSTLKDKLNWIFALARNKLTQTATTQLVRNDGDSGTIGTSTDSDDGTTFTRGKFS